MQKNKEKAFLFKTLEDTAKVRWGLNSYLVSAGMSFDIKKLSKKKIDKIINSKVSGENFSDRIWDNKNKTTQVLRKKIKNFMEGKISANAIEKDIKLIFKSNKFNSKRLVVDQVARVQSRVNEEWYKEQGIEHLLYSATLDSKTCDDCSPYDGEVYRVNESRPVLPNHPFCRCTYIELPHKDWKPKSRRENLTGKTINYKNYKEWAIENGLN